MRQDIVYAWRLLLKNPGFSVAVVLSLALGIGANTAIFSLIDAVMWRTLPVSDAASLRVIDPNLTYQQYRRLTDETQVADLAAYSTVRVQVSVNGSLEPTSEGQLVTGDYFSSSACVLAAAEPSAPKTTGFQMAIRSPCLATAIGNAGSAAIRRSSDRRSHFGRTVHDHRRYAAGILRRGSRHGARLFIPVMMQPTVMPACENLLTIRSSSAWLTSLGRLKPGVQEAAAVGTLATVWREMLARGGPPIEDAFALDPAATGL